MNTTKERYYVKQIGQAWCVCDREGGPGEGEIVCLNEIQAAANVAKARAQAQMRQLNKAQSEEVAVGGQA